MVRQKDKVNTHTKGGNSQLVGRENEDFWKVMTRRNEKNITQTKNNLTS